MPRYSHHTLLRGNLMMSSAVDSHPHLSHPAPVTSGRTDIHLNMTSRRRLLSPTRPHIHSPLPPVTQSHYEPQEMESEIANWYPTYDHDVTLCMNHLTIVLFTSEQSISSSLPYQHPSWTQHRLASHLIIRHWPFINAVTISIWACMRSCRGHYVATKKEDEIEWWYYNTRSD